MSELKLCSYCKSVPQANTWTLHGITETRYFCPNPDCPHSVRTVRLEEWQTRPIEDALNARIAELEALVDELKPYRDGYDPEKDFPPEGEWVWLRDCDDDIEPVQYDPKSGWYWNYEGNWMPDNGDIRRWYPVGTLPEVQE
jgi:hypothetical protein